MKTRHAVPTSIGVTLCLLATVSVGSARTATVVKINFDKDAIKPTPVQNAAIRHAAASEIADFIHPEQGGYAVAQADLNDDGHADLLVQYNDVSFCGSSGCSGVIVMATPHGYAGHAIGLPNFGTMAVLASKHHGMHDLQYNGDSPIWTWNGKTYDIDKADAPGASAPAWEIRHAGGHTVALVTPIDSVIRNLSLFCSHGRPVLAMAVTASPPAGPVTLSFGFRGWTVNAAMAPAGPDGRNWFADLSRSDLPLWLAHRGTTRITRELARLATESFLKINGALQGDISLKNSTAATQTALGGCYRY